MTLDTSKVLGISNEVIELQFANIYSKSSVNEVSKYSIGIFFREEHPRNIEFIFITLLVTRFGISKLSKFTQL